MSLAFISFPRPLSLWLVPVAAVSLLLSACGGSSGGDTAPPPSGPTYSVSLTVSGLAGSGLVLQNNLGNDLTVAANGTATFTKALADGSNYSITVKTQPGNPSQSCSVTNGSGTISGSNITDVAVACTTNLYTIGGTLSGLAAGTSVVLLNNGSGDLNVNSNGSFTFTTPLSDLSAYAVTVKNHPTGQLCTASNGSGTLAGANVTNVAISCQTGYTVGGTVSGLSGSGLVLQNGGGDDLTINANGLFTFTTPLANAASYNVTVRTQPSGPRQLCSVSSGSGVVSSADITQVAVSCTAQPKYAPGIFHSTQLGEERAFGLALGDIDQDGDMDLISAHGSLSWPAANAIWKNDGSGSGNFFGYTPATTFGATEYSNALALADLDGDGDEDLVVGNDGANTVWFNQGGSQGGVKGAYVNSGQTLGAENTVSVVAGDLDNDGDLDLVEGNNWDLHAIWLNDGSGDFGSAASQQMGGTQSYSYQIVLADIDADGDLDIIEASGDGLMLWHNQGGKQGGTLGSFATTAVVLDSNGARAVAAGDVDGDGDRDIVVGHWGANKVWLNNGTGSFSNSGQALGSSDTSSIELADFDGDGDLDIVDGNDWGQPHQIWFNNNGVFTSSEQWLNTGVLTHDMAVADLDDDGDLDIAEAHYNGTNLWINQGDGHFADPQQHLGDRSWTREIELVDLDLDGDLDLIDVAAEGANSVWLNDGSGNLGTTAAQSFGYDETTGSAVGDLNGDGYPDLVEANYLSQNRLRLNNGDGTFTLYNSFGPSSYSQSVSIGDLDGDGDRDVIIGSAGGGNTLWLNDGAGNLTAGATLDASWTYAIELGDVDGDGDLDMIFAESATDDGLWINQGGAQGGTPGSFVQSAQVLGSTYITDDIEMADLDNDGDLDLVFGYHDGFYTTPGDAIYINQGGNQGGTEGVFVNSGIVLDGANTNSIEVGDLDDDGDLDIVKGNASSANTLWLNQGGAQGGTLGTFQTSPQTISGGSSTEGLALGDLDNDGDLDIVEGVTQSPNLVYPNMTYWP